MNNHVGACYRQALILNWWPLVITDGRLFCSKSGVRLIRQTAACFGYAGLVLKLHDSPFILLALINKLIQDKYHSTNT